MNIGPISIPVGPVVFFASVVVAVLAGRFFDRRSTEVEAALVKSVVIGLVVARVSFVLLYLPGYEGSFLRMLDFRDIGFSLLPGVLAGIIVVLWTVARRPNIRRAMLVGATAGLVAWFGGSAASHYWKPSSMVPVVSLANTNGTLTALGARDGKPLVVNLWATWCAPCQDEMPALADIQREYPGIDLVFVNQGEPPAVVDAFLRRLNLDIANVLFDPQLDVAKAASVSAYPTTLFYDASGHLLDSHVGRLSRATFAAAVEHLYASAGASQSH